MSVTVVENDNWDVENLRLPLVTAFLVAGALISTLHFDAFYYSHDAPKWFLFDLFLSSYIFYSLLRKNRIYLSYFSLLCVALLLMMALCMVQAPHRYAGLEMLVRYGLAVGFGYCLLQDFSQKKLGQLLMWVTLVSALSFSLLFILERFVWQLPYNSGTFSPLGYINHAGHVFNIWIPVLVLFCYQYRRAPLLLGVGIFTLLVVVYVLMSAATRGTIIGLTLSEVMVFLIAIRKNRKQALVFLTITTLLALGIGLYQVSDDLQNGRLSQKITSMQNGVESAANGRFDMYRNTRDMTLANPMGVGTNNFEYLHPYYARPGTSEASPFVNEKQILRTPHNILAKLFSELGIVGGGIAVALFAYLFLVALYQAIVGSYFDKWLFVAVSATMAHSMVSAVFLTPASLFFSAILFSLVNKRFIQGKSFASWSVPGGKVIAPLVLVIPLLSTAWISSEFYAWQGRSYFDAELLSRATKLNPGNDRAYYNLSQVYQDRHRDVEASLEAINRFLELYPYHISALFIQAERLFQLGRLDEAQHSLDKVLTFYPTFKKAKRLQYAVQRKKLILRREGASRS